MFTQKISMDCTKEQYEKYLKEELLKMGYKEDDWSVSPMIIVNNAFGGNNFVGMYGIGCKNSYNRTYLGSFNAPLFLALAAMTDKEFGGYGEYWVFLGRESAAFTNGKLYRCIGHYDDGAPMFISNNNVRDGYHSSVVTTMFRKATKYEIEAELGKEVASTDPIMGLLNQVKDLLALIINTESSSKEVKDEFSRALRAFSERGIPVYEEMKKLEQMKYSGRGNNAINDGSEIDRDKILHELSKSLFGKAAIVMTRDSGIKIGREDLRGRSLYVGNKYDVKLHKLDNGDTIIEFTEGK